MDIYLWKPEEYQRLYNCSFYKIEKIPLEKRQHIFLGISFIILFFVFEILYIPCILSIRKHLEHSCYKIMFYMGINDILALSITGLLVGIFGIYGAVFCSFPNLIYITGFLSTVFWYNETISAIILALNRCMDISMPTLAQHLFEGHKTWLLLIIPFSYAFILAASFKVVLFNSMLFIFSLNPHFGYVTDDFDTNYDNPIISLNSALMITLFPGFYLLFLVALICKNRSIGVITTASHMQRKIFIQVMGISLMNITAACIFTFMQYVLVNEYLIYLSMTAALFAQGFKPVIYLSLNNTIRQDVITMFCKPNQNHVTATEGITRKTNRNGQRAINRGSAPIA